MQFADPQPPSSPLLELRECLATLPTGRVENRDALVKMLMLCWEEFDGSRETRMGVEKLHRIEDVQWNPPELTFLLERHAGTVLGSTRAEVHRWTIDVVRGEAKCELGKYRQVRPRAAPLQVDAIVSEIVGCIVSGAPDPRLKWLAAGAEVRVLVSTFIRGDKKQTEQNRRQRFREEFVSAIEEKGWVAVPRRTNVFRRLK